MPHERRDGEIVEATGSTDLRPSRSEGVPTAEVGLLAERLRLMREWLDETQRLSGEQVRLLEHQSAQLGLVSAVVVEGIRFGMTESEEIYELETNINEPAKAINV